MEKQSWVIDGDSYSESYTYNDPIVGADASVRPKDGSLASVTTATGDKILYTYDSLKRLGGTAVENAAGGPLFRTGYSYKAGAETNQTTDQVLVYTTWDPNYSNILSYRYSYDALGNITKIEDVTNAARTLAEYTYDELNQLTQEKIYNYADDSANYTSIDTYVYTYDSAGNILKEKKNNTVVNAYTYSTGPWADQLVAVNGEEITYDGSGNPEIYVSGYGVAYHMGGFDGRNWLGFQTMTGPQLQVEYTYDADGIRTSKNVDQEEHTYVTQNGKVVRETIGTGATAKVLDFIYDNSGKPFALTYTDGTAEPQRYYYVLNLQGDVVALITADCTIVAQYTYNAWGKLLSVTDEDGNAITSASHIANLNPIRYRGYYYDTETGFYYLQTRYYDPANHRFINADCYTSTGQGFLGCNMFAYCNNDPLNQVDTTGTMNQAHLYEGGKPVDCSDAFKEFLRLKKAAAVAGSGVYYTEYSALMDWRYTYLPLSRECEYVAYLYKTNTCMGTCYYFSPTGEGTRNNVIVDTTFLKIKDLLELTTAYAQVHTHPLPGHNMHNDFPSYGDELAYDLFNYSKLYIIPYAKCDDTPIIISLTEPETWCQNRHAD